MHGHRTEGVRDASERSVPQPEPTLLHKTPTDVLAGYCSRCGRRRPSAAAVYPPPPLPTWIWVRYTPGSGSIKVIDPYLGALIVRRTIIDLLEHSVLTLAARGPTAGGGPWLMSSGGGARAPYVGGRDGWKMEDEDGGRTGHPDEF